MQRPTSSSRPSSSTSLCLVVSSDQAASPRPAASHLTALLAVSLLLLLAVGCNRDNKPLVRISNSDNTFVWDARLDHDDDDEDHDFFLFDDYAHIEFESFDLSGEVEIELYDDDGDRVFRATYNSHEGRRRELDDSDRGAPGEWTVRIITRDASGHGVLRIERRWEN